MRRGRRRPTRSTTDGQLDGERGPELTARSGMEVRDVDLDGRALRPRRRVVGDGEGEERRGPGLDRPRLEPQPRRARGRPDAKRDRGGVPDPHAQALAGLHAETRLEGNRAGPEPAQVLLVAPHLLAATDRPAPL